MDQELIQRLAEFFGVEATPEAVYAALQQLITEIETELQQPAESIDVDEVEVVIDGVELSELTEEDAAAGRSAAFRDLRAATGVATDKALLALFKSYAQSLAPRTLNVDALRAANTRFAHLRTTDPTVVTRPLPPNAGPATSPARSNRYGGVTIMTQNHRNSTLGAVIQRAMKAGNNSATGPLGGFAVGHEVSTEFIQDLRPQIVLKQAGIRETKLNGTASRDIPKISKRGAAFWVGQGKSVTADEIQMQMLTLRPKKLAALALISNELLYTDVGDAEARIREICIASCAIEIDRAGLYGTGSRRDGQQGEEPLGVLNTPGVVVTALDPDINAGRPTASMLRRQKTAIKKANVTLSKFGHITGPGVGGYFEDLSDTTGQPNQRITVKDGIVHVGGYPVYETSNVSEEEVVAGNDDTSHIFSGEWSLMEMGLGVDFEITVLKERYAESLMTGVLIWTTVDFVLHHAEAFRVLSGVRTEPLSS